MWYFVDLNRENEMPDEANVTGRGEGDAATLNHLAFDGHLERIS
jgi:hypothetical protein